MKNAAGFLILSAALLSPVAFADEKLPETPCGKIVDACMKAGFVDPHGRNGTGLVEHCLNPILQGTKGDGAKLPLPKVDPALVTACKASHKKN